MPIPRATTNLKHTSIQDHLLKGEEDSKSVMHNPSETNISEVKLSLYNSTINTNKAKAVTALDDKCCALVTSMIDNAESSVTINTDQPTTTSPQIDLSSKYQLMDIPTFAGGTNGRW